MTATDRTALPPYPTAEGLEVEELGLPPIAAPEGPGVGALAVLDSYADRLGWPDNHDLRQARAAVAELVEAGTMLERREVRQSRTISSVFTSNVTRLRAALRNVTGGEA